MSVEHSELPWVFSLARNGRSIHITTLAGVFVGEIYEATWLGARSVGDRQRADAGLISACLVEHATSASFRSLFSRAEGERLKDLERLLTELGGSGLETDISPEEQFERALLFVAEMRAALRFYGDADHYAPGSYAPDDIRSVVEGDGGSMARVTLRSQP